MSEITAIVELKKGGRVVITEPNRNALGIEEGDLLKLTIEVSKKRSEK